MASDTQSLDSIRNTLGNIGISGTTYLEIVSQLCVIAKVIRDNSSVKMQWESEPYLKDKLILINSHTSKTANHVDLIDIDQPVWASLSTQSVDNMVRILAQKGGDLLELIEGFYTSDRGVNTSLKPAVEIAELAYKLLNEPKELALYGEPAHHSLIDFIRLKNVPKLTVANLNMERAINHQLFERISFLGEEATKIKYASTEPYELIGNAQFLHSPWRKKNSREKFNQENLPAELRNKANRLSVEEHNLIEIIHTMQATRLAAIMPASFLSQGGLTADVRNWLLGTNKLKTAIELPEKSLSGTGARACLLVFSDEHSTDVTLFNVSKEYTESHGRMNFIKNVGDLITGIDDSKNSENRIVVSHDELLESDSNLSASRYLAQRNSSLSKLLANYKCVSLAAVAEIYRPITVTKESLDGAEHTEVLLSDINTDGLVTSGSRKKMLDIKSSKKLNKVILRKGDIVLGVKGTVGKVGLVGDIADKHFVGQSMVVIKLKSEALLHKPEVLFQYLSLPAVRSFLESMARGAAIQFISAKDLGNLQIPLLSERQQNEMGNTFNTLQDKHKEIAKLQQEIKQINENTISGLEEKL